MTGTMSDDFFRGLLPKHPRHRQTHEDSAAKVFSWQGTDLGQSVTNRESWVALDTNVLLLPYGAGKSSFREILEAYRSLSRQDRLVVPGQVAREFARNRPAKLGDTVKAINDLSSNVPSLRQIQRYLLLDELPTLREAKDASDKASLAIKDYKKALSDLSGEVRKLVHADPVLAGYQEVLDEGVVIDPEISDGALDANIRFRMENSIPPGQKDKGKEDGGFGDVLIWLTLLQLAAGSSRDMIFVTEERKSDWWHRNDSAPLLPRYELVDEYRRVSNGGTLHLVSLSRLLSALKTNEEVVAEIKALEVATDSSNGAKYVRDGETLLIRGASGYGAILPIRQTMPPDADEAVDYFCWFSEDLNDFLQNCVTPVRGHCSAAVGKVTVGPYEIPWSGSGNGTGWFYYREYSGSSSSAVDYELAVIESGVVAWDYFSNGLFFRGKDLV